MQLRGRVQGNHYHYFQTKDELYLACVDECFRALTEYLGEKLILEGETVHRQLQLYLMPGLNFSVISLVPQNFLRGSHYAAGPSGISCQTEQVRV